MRRGPGAVPRDRAALPSSQLGRRHGAVSPFPHRALRWAQAECCLCPLGCRAPALLCAEVMVPWPRVWSSARSLQRAFCLGSGAAPPPPSL